VLSTELSVPAVGQGVIGIEARADDVATHRLVAALDHADTHARLRAERAFAQELQGSCHSPLAAYAEIAHGRLHLVGYVGAPDGTETYRAALGGDTGDAEAIGHELARQLKSAGAGALLDRLRATAIVTPL
jgi:hydroxymethylbilane synthase